MSCEEFGEAIVAEVVDRLETSESESLQAHIASCLRCAAERYEVRAFVERLRAAGGPVPSAGFVERLRGRLVRESLSPSGLLPALRARLAESVPLRIAASLLLVQLIGIPVLAAVLRLRSESAGFPRITIDPPPPPPLREPVEPARPFVWPEEGTEIAREGATGVLALRDRLRPLRRARAEVLAEAGRAERILARGGPSWLEEELADARDRLRADPEAFTRPERAPFTLLALLWTEARQGRARDAAAILDLADRLAPAAATGDPRASFALWEALLADAVPLGNPARWIEALPVRLVGLDAALAARMAAEALECEVLTGPFAGAPASEGIQAGFPEESWTLEGLQRFAREGGDRAGGARPGLSIEDAFAMRGFVATEGRVPAVYVEPLERARREGELQDMPPERATLLLAAFLAPQR